MANLIGESRWSTSNIVGILSFVATALAFGASFLGQLDPHYAVYAMALSGGITAFCGRIQGTPGK